MKFFPANFFANTPDILPYFLQPGGRPFLIRAVLAATLSPVYGIYSGFELCEHVPIPGKEEYYDSEKYQFKDATGTLRQHQGVYHQAKCDPKRKSRLPRIR